MSFFFFFCCDQCLKEEVGMAEVGCGSWLDPVFGSWLKWVVGRRRSLMFGSGEVMARSAWVTVMGLVEIGVGHGVGHRMVGWFFWVSDGGFFFFNFLLFFFLLL